MSQTFKVNPNGDRESHSIDKVNFLNIIPLNQTKQPRPYLIIGFDTEYQSTDRLIKNKIYCDNDVLSYQFYCSLITHDNKGSEVEWGGIILPDSNSIKDRLTIKEFIEFAIGEGITKNPKIRIPRDIYFVSHFTRCDIPGFKDFKDVKNIPRLNFQNIRGSFVNVTQDLPIILNDSKSNEEIKVFIKVRDTIHLSPQQSGSLDKLGDILGFEKIKLGRNSIEEKEIKTHMKDFLDNDWEKFREYGIRDSEICVRWVNRLIRLNHEVHDYQSKHFKLPLTLSAIGVSLLEKHWLDNNSSRLEIINLEEVIKKTWDSRFGRFRYTKKERYKEEFSWVEEFITQSYHGGRNEGFWFGNSHEDEWTDFDLSGCYPTIMSLIGKPDWSSQKQIQTTDEMLSFKPVDLSYCCVEFEFPKSVRFPTLPVRTDEGIIFPRKGRSTCHISEILLSKKLGCDLKLVYGFTWKSERFKGLNNRVFREFLIDCSSKRNQYEKKTVDNLFWKEISNSIYGKTGQGLRERRIYDLKSDSGKRLGRSKITNPVFASFITSFSRGVLGEIMNNLPRDVNVFSVTTDGFLTNSTQDQIDKSIHGVLCNYFRDGRIKIGGKDDVIEVKHKTRQLLGWRTRGQSTLKPSIDSDWENPSKVKDDEKIVLAKSGIKLPNILGKEEENDEIVKLFYQRKPTDQIPISIGLGIKELYRGGYDFVHKEMDKRLSMEFDWKRKPLFVGESEVKYKNLINQKHLFFSTQPWESVDDFLTIRYLWSEYNKVENHCLKTIEDYQDFNNFVQSNLSLSDENKRYLKRKNGDLIRLRKNIIISWKYRESGTDENLPCKLPPPFKKPIWKDKTLTSRELTYLLNDVVGIPCKKSDVDNDKKNSNSFVKHSTPNTQLVRDKLFLLKRDVFPKLVIDDFLPSKSELNLDSVELKDCVLSQQMF